MIRNYKPEDYEQVKRLHELSGDDYIFPDCNSPLFVSAKVIEVDGKVVMYQGARIQAEMYFLGDKDFKFHPRDKMRLIKALDYNVRLDAWVKGVDDVVCYVPPTKKRFVKRIMEWLGYQPPREGWTPLSRPTKETQ